MPLSRPPRRARGVGRAPRRRAAARASSPAALAVRRRCSPGCSARRTRRPVDPRRRPSRRPRRPTGEPRAVLRAAARVDRVRRVECATAQVPFDYADPAGPSIGIALAAPRPRRRADRVAADQPRRPGASGVEFVEPGRRAVQRRRTRAVRPRRVRPAWRAAVQPGRVRRRPRAGRLARDDPDYSTDAGIQDVIDRTASSATRAGRPVPLLGHVDTVSAARDMDVLRAALGDEKLNYLGYSYGTALGATYAVAVPGEGRPDGARRRARPDAHLRRGGATAGRRLRERAARLRRRTARRPALPARRVASTRGSRRSRDLLDRARRQPAADRHRPRSLTRTLAFYGIAQPLYAQSLWPYLTQAPDRRARAGRRLDLLAARGPVLPTASRTARTPTTRPRRSGRSTASTPAAPPDSTPCAPRPRRSRRPRPTVGEFFGYGGVGVRALARPRGRRARLLAAEGAAPILVIGTTNDPATPVRVGEQLAEQLSSGVLLTYEGEGHTAYGRSNACIAGRRRRLPAATADGPRGRARAAEGSPRFGAPGRPPGTVRRARRGTSVATTPP